MSDEGKVSGRDFRSFWAAQWKTTGINLSVPATSHGLLQMEQFWKDRLRSRSLNFGWKYKKKVPCSYSPEGGDL